MLMLEVTFVRPQFWGRKWLGQFYGRPDILVLSAGKPYAHNLPRFKGGILEFFERGG